MSMAEAESFSDVLNDPQGRHLVDQIEDVLSSLRNQPDDLDLQRLLARLIDQLERTSGYRYTFE